MPEETSSRMEILIYGDFTWDRLAASYKREFEILGHRVYSVHTTERPRYLAPWLSSRSIRYLTRNRLSLRHRGSKRWNAHLLEKAESHQPDFVLLLNGHFVMPETIERLHSRGFPVYIFHADNPFAESPSSRPENVPCARVCTAYFIWSRELQERLEELNVDAHYLSFGWDPFVFPYQSDVHEPEHDVVFIGGWDEYREEWLTPVADQFQLRIWGPEYWGARTARGSPVRECWQGRAVRGKDAAEVIARSKIVVNILRRQNLPDGTNMRTFEVPGSGGFLLATRTQGATELLPEGTAGAYFGSPEELIEKIQFYLDHGEAREVLAEQAHSRVRRLHRYRNRAQAILDYHDSLSVSGRSRETAGVRSP